MDIRAELFTWNMTNFIVTTTGQWKELRSNDDWADAATTLETTTIPLAFRRALKAAMDKLRDQ